MMRGKAAILTACVLLAGGLAGCIGGDESEDGTDAPGGVPGTVHQTTETYEASVTFSAGAMGMCLAGPTSQPVQDARPGNLTGVLLELSWEAATQDGGLGQMMLNATVDGRPVNSTAGAADNGTLRLWVTPDAWETGVLQANYCASGEGTQPNAVTDATTTLYATVFTGGMPDWGFTAAG